MKVVLLRVGRGGVKWADTAVEDYTRRFRTHLAWDEERIPTANFRGDIEAVRNEEGARILARIRDRDRLIALDERGEAPSTEGFAEWINGAAQAGVGRLVFAIGGPYGHSAAVRRAAWKTLSLSSMVTNHELARVFLAEQMYRASTLIWGGSYHH